MSCSNQTICYTSPHLSLHVPFFFLLIILTHCYVIVNSFYYPPLQAYLQYKKSFHYISNPSCVGLITALCSLSNSNIVISFLIMLIGTLLYKSEFDALIVEDNLQRSCKFSLENKASVRKMRSIFRACSINDDKLKVSSDLNHHLFFASNHSIMS